MKKLKKLTAVLTAAAMLAGGNISVLSEKMTEVSVPSVSASYEEIIASGECGAQGDNLTWTLDSEGTLTISGVGEMADWEYPPNISWYSYNENIVNVIIENGVTSIGVNAFCACEILTTIEISDSVTSIGDYAFHNCKNLASITIPDSVTSIGY